jgi:hypothetical protein
LVYSQQGNRRRQERNGPQKEKHEYEEEEQQFRQGKKRYLTSPDVVIIIPYAHTLQFTFTEEVT